MEETRKEAQTERVSVHEAARLLGIAPQGVREHMKRGILDLGVVVPSAKKGGKRQAYLIYREKLNRVLGKGDA